jgi:DNA processing protein
VSHDAGLAAWLRLTLTPGLGGESQRKLLAAFGLPEAIFEADPVDRHHIIGKRADLLDSPPPTTAIETALRWAETSGHYILTLADAAYPQALLQIPDPPSVLYVRGRLDTLNLPTLGMVGSRNATPLGERTAESFARILAGQGWCIASGLALGIDAAAHRGALAAAGMTVAVIGTGIDRLYPARNKDLALAIAERGSIVSEFPLGTPVQAANFPRRNRIIAGLSRGVLVVEAAPESGSLITARLAAEQGREVFAIPGSIHSPVARGCHQLIKQGAKLVETAEDVLEELGSSPRPTGMPQNTMPDAEDHEDTPLLAALAHGPLLLDELAQHTGLEADTLLATLLDLELAGRIAPLPGNRYQRLD